MIIESTKSIGGYEVKPGASIPYRSNSESLIFQVRTVCVTDKPERWRGEIRFRGQLLIETEEVDDHNKAGRLAEQAFEARVVQVFRGTT